MTHATIANSPTARLAHIRGDDAIPGISQAVIVEHGRIAYLSGHLPISADGEAPDRFEEQLARVFASLRSTLEDLHATSADLIRITIYVVGLSEDRLPLIRAARDQFLGNSDNPPASALLGVASLFRPEIQVEIDAIVSLPG
ncbi:RidA family protein [Leucobacter chromiireducens]|uniref:RidA family protein n=1 Tax=Leucobacter chromiireducens subsp. solipictus TaxID=398235 RepID=A0ABS1SEB2_9MICO|nr:RidA family protein [Leucobacter chromiireducens]MBL3678893.1 RidA family protein [Leucobacter chromiireducens subsp. solipictus]